MIDTLVQGILLGGYYAILAAGLSFLYSVMGIFNLAHGSFAVLAAYAIVMLCDLVGLDPFVALALVVMGMGVLGVVVERLVFEPSTRGGPLLSVLATFGLAVALDNAMFQFFGANTRSLAPFIGDLSWASWEIGNTYVGKLAVMTLVAAILVLGGLQLFLTRTPFGRAIRATALDADTAGLVGIDTRRARMTAAAIAFMTIGLAGAALGMRATFTPYTGTPQLLFAFQAAVIGAPAGIWGTLIGGIILGLAQSIGAEISTQGFFIAGNVVFFAILFARLYGGRLGLPTFKIKRGA